jgi:DNA polymerase V
MPIPSLCWGSDGETIRELRSESCIEIEEVEPAKKQIISSRSFGQPVTACDDLEEALAHFVSNAAVKLRKHMPYGFKMHVKSATKIGRNHT